VKRPGPMLLLTSVLPSRILAQRADPRLVVSLRVMRAPCLIIAAAAALCGSPAAAQAPGSTLAAFVNQHHRAARQLENEGKYREAESRLQEALRAARQFGPANPWVAGILDDLGSIYHILREDWKAEDHYLRAIRTWEKAAGDSADGLAFSLNNLAFLCMRQGRYGKAEPLFLRAIEIRKAHAGPDHLDVGRSLQDLALLRLTQRRFDEARQYLRQAETVYATNPEAGPNDQAFILRDLGLLELDLGRPERAVSYIDRAVAAWEKQIEANNPLLAGPLNDLAIACLRLGDTKRAEPLVQRALTLAETAFDPDHPIFASLFETKAQLLRQSGRKSEARQLVKRAKQIRAAHASGSQQGHSVDIDSLRPPRR
jgi:tetratricopeptide (TPR) repeat protein